MKQSTKRLATKTTPVKPNDDDASNVNKVSAMISLAEAADILGIHRTTAWAINDRGDFPVPVLRVGGHWRVVRAHLQHFLDTGERVTLPFKPKADSTSVAS